MKERKHLMMKKGEQVGQMYNYEKIAPEILYAPI